MTPAARNVALYPWFKLSQNLLFWQAVWFLYFQSELSAAEAILIYVIYDVAVTVFEVPSGWLSDRIGRRVTLIASAAMAVVAMALQAFGSGFWVFALGQAALGVHIAFASGTDTSFLYESLAAEGREGEVEQQEVRAWRFTFAGLAISALAGGALALIDMRLAFVASMLAGAISVLIAWRFTETGTGAAPPVPGEVTHFGLLRHALADRTLVWLFALSVLMYGYSHIPFVFGQPFILQSLQGAGLASEAPVFSGAVTATMMLVSVATSWLAPGLRKRVGLGGLLLLAFGLQVALAASLAATGSTLAIGLLFLRMVPDSLSRPFILARIQPILRSEVRATYLSVKSLAGRILFALSLWLAAGSASDVDEMGHGELHAILWAYAAAGLAAFVLLAVTARGRRL